MSDADKTNLMAPDASPGTVKTGVRRVNNMPIILLCAVGAAFLLIMGLVAKDRAEQQDAPQKQEKAIAGNTAMYANEIAGNQVGGFIPPDDLPVVPEDNAPEVTPSATGTVDSGEIPDRYSANQPPLPPGVPPGSRYQPGPAPPAQPAEDDDEAQRIRMAKYQQLEQAIRARTGVDATITRSSGAGSSQSRPISSTPRNRQEMIDELARVRRQMAGSGRTDPMAAYQERLAQVQAMNTGGASGAAATPAPTMAGSSSGGLFGSQQQNAGADRWHLGSRMQNPGSPYELRAGFIIPATLISGVNSDLPGQIVAQVSQDVSDTATGRHLLIPQGSRLVGSYSSDVAYGQKRVLISWKRIDFPDGRALDIGSMPGADQSGYSGFEDQVNNHYVRIFGSALLMTGVTAAVTLSQDNDDSDDDSDKQRANDALSEALGQQLGQVAVEMIRKNMNIAPTLEIRPGYRFNVIVTKDLTFDKPYQSFDY